jgi:putative transposase
MPLHNRTIKLPWLGQVDVETLSIEPGSRWENEYAETFHSRLRDELLASGVFESLSAAVWRFQADENGVVTQKRDDAAEIGSLCEDSNRSAVGKSLDVLRAVQFGPTSTNVPQ